ncbi:MAG: hypothetical protein JSS81_01140 [Acidobacteria bacterium]|nr:hypothetical protein [Acidobacteriota bacterium]
MLLLFLYQLDKLRPEKIFGGQVLERTPAGLSIVYLIGVLILLWFLVLSFWGNFRRPKFMFEQNLSRDVVKKLSSTLTNRSLRLWQIVFVLLALTVYGFHVYWTYYADDYNQKFQELSYKDLRNRRTNASTLRGWMLDRSGKLTSALAYYRIDKDGEINRYFPLEKEMAHFLGTERGTPGLERTLYKREADPMPESWEILTKYKKPEPENKDVRITIDRDLQSFLAQQLQGKKGAIVVLNPQSGDILGMYSNPSFSLSEAESLDGYLKLEADKMNQPLLSRATRAFYVPGSTFKTLTMMSAFRAGKQDSVFPSYPEGYRPVKGYRPIVDATQKFIPPDTVVGSCDGGCEEKNIALAYKVSSNQYFAQLANELGRDRMKETANLVGIAAVETPEEASFQGFYSDIINASDKRIAAAMAPARSTMVTGSKITAFDFGLEGMGQGYAGQMTPFQMAMIASVPANMNGALMKPKIEADLQPQPFAQILNKDQASVIREIMSSVVEEPGGTGAVVAGKLGGTGIRVGGKTGTAEKVVPLYDEKTGKRVTVKKKRKNAQGEIEEYDDPQSFERTDSWFICIGPLGAEDSPEAPQFAIAVVVEAGGFGATTAAPIAANVVLKLRELGLLGDKYKPKTQQTTTKKNKK